MREDDEEQPQGREPQGEGAPPPPPPPPPATGWTSQPWPVPGAAKRPTLDVASVVGRTFDTLGREWSLFLALAVPAGLGGFASAALTATFQDIIRDPASARADQLPLLGAQLIIALLTAVTTLATVIATDALWRGRPVGLGDAIGAAVSVLPRALALLLLALLLLAGLVLVLVGGALLVVALGPLGALLGLAGAVILVGALIYVSARLSLVLPVLVLEGVPVTGVIGRAWRLAEGSVLRLIATTLVIGICALFPAWGGTVFSVFVEDRVVAGIAVGLATMVTAPLSGIWIVLAWGQLTGAPYADSPVMAAGKGRLTAILLIAGVGLVLMLVGGALAGAASADLLRDLEGN